MLGRKPGGRCQPGRSASAPRPRPPSAWDPADAAPRHGVHLSRCPAVPAQPVASTPSPAPHLPARFGPSWSAAQHHRGCGLISLLREPPLAPQVGPRQGRLGVVCGPFGSPAESLTRHRCSVTVSMAGHGAPALAPGTNTSALTCSRRRPELFPVPEPRPPGTSQPTETHAPESPGARPRGSRDRDTRTRRPLPGTGTHGPDVPPQTQGVAAPGPRRKMQPQLLTQVLPKGGCAAQPAAFGHSRAAGRRGGG